MKFKKLVKKIGKKVKKIAKKVEKHIIRPIVKEVKNHIIEKGTEVIIGSAIAKSILPTNLNPSIMSTESEVPIKIMEHSNQSMSLETKGLSLESTFYRDEQKEYYEPIKKELLDHPKPTEKLYENNCHKDLEDFLKKIHEQTENPNRETIRQSGTQEENFNSQKEKLYEKLKKEKKEKKITKDQEPELFSMFEDPKPNLVREIIEICRIHPIINGAVTTWNAIALAGRLMSKARTPLIQTFFQDAEIAIQSFIMSRGSQLTEEELKQNIELNLDFAYERSLHIMDLD